MHLKVFLKLKKTLKLSLLGKYIKKSQKKPKNPTGLVFFFKPGLFPTLQVGAEPSSSVRHTGAKKSLPAASPVLSRTRRKNSLERKGSKSTCDSKQQTKLTDYFGSV
jgi:hypothetical protein